MAGVLQRMREAMLRSASDCGSFFSAELVPLRSRHLTAGNLPYSYARYQFVPFC
ncbi:MAG: hypothetical protein VB031_07875 [Eubacteriaceae bacterium]|nr:hypothetical protein [Eubacteriaceae bacterium]